MPTSRTLTLSEMSVYEYHLVLGVSLMFSAGGKLVFTGGQKLSSQPVNLPGARSLMEPLFDTVKPQFHNTSNENNQVHYNPLPESALFFSKNSNQISSPLLSRTL